MGKTVDAKNQALFKQIAPQELKKGELRKLEIVQGFLTCLAKHGWARTNYETVGQICGMKRPHVAYHYPEWMDLVEAAMRFGYATGGGIVADYLRTCENPKDALRAYIEGTFHWLEVHPQHGAAITLLWHLSTFDRRFLTLSATYKRLGLERVHAILHPTAPVDHKSEAWATSVAVHALLVGRCVEYVTGETKPTAARMAEETWRQAQALAKRSSSRKASR